MGDDRGQWDPVEDGNAGSRSGAGEGRRLRRLPPWLWFLWFQQTKATEAGPAAVGATEARMEAKRAAVEA